MADEDQLQILKGGTLRWNAWRKEHHDIKIDFSEAFLSDINLSSADLHDADFRAANLSHAAFISADLSNADLSGVNLTGVANLNGANLSGASLREAWVYNAYAAYTDFSGADLRGTDFRNTDLRGSKFFGADLSGADLSGATLEYANFSGATLKDANLELARFIDTNLSEANLEGCNVYGVSAWGLTLDGANQKNLRITPDREPAITVDDLEVAQFIYLMLNNQKVRRVINTIATKTVLILGRFTEERKAILDAMREELRQQDYLPIIFDFDKPATRDLTETVSTLAHMSRFIIADITDPKSIPQELQAIIPNLPSVPVQPLILASEHEYGMFEHFKRYPWVLTTHVYESSDKLIAELKEKVITPSEAKAKELHA